ncbi:MAG: hypothetical protein NT166_10575 [Candidatus Aminicenantes bacterium]|nr:hypothetical protein [Candidatus Aminicenantes bacterium]
MGKINVNMHLKMLLGVIFLMALNLQVFPVIFGNGSGNGYCDGIPKPGCLPPPGLAAITPGNGPGIEALVREGGGYFLNAHSLTMALLNQVEMSDLNGLDYDILNKTANDALLNIRCARSIYIALVDMAENTLYNPEVTAKLRAFDYRAFMEKNNLNREIFKKLAAYLSSDDITGMYRHILHEITGIETLLTTICSDIALHRQPGLQLLWKTGETFSETLLFGHYAARVFYAL